jgi:hypothetical protein
LDVSDLSFEIHHGLLLWLLIVFYWGILLVCLSLTEVCIGLAFLWAIACEVSCLSAIKTGSSTGIHIASSGVCCIATSAPVIVLIEGSVHAVPIQIHWYRDVLH